jgi:hypothetical protein
MLLHGCPPHPHVQLGDGAQAMMPFMAAVAVVIAVYLAIALAVTLAVIGGTGMMATAAADGGGGGDDKGLEFARFVIGAGGGALPTVLLYAEEQAMLGLGATGMPMLIGGALYSALTAGCAFAAPASWGAFGIGVAWSAGAWVAWLATEAMVATICRHTLWVWRVSVLAAAHSAAASAIRMRQSSTPATAVSAAAAAVTPGGWRRSASSASALALALAVGNALPLLRQLAIASWLAIDASSGANQQFSAASTYFQCLLVAALAASSVVTAIAAAAYQNTATSKAAARRESAIAALFLLVAAAAAALLPFVCPAVFVGFGGDIRNPNLWLFAVASAVGFVAVVAACVCDGVTHGRRVVWMPLGLKVAGCVAVAAVAAAMASSGGDVGPTHFAVAMLLVSSAVTLLESAVALFIAARWGWL